MRLLVVDVAGREVAHLVDRTLPAGAHEVTWDGRTAGGTRAPSGVYLVVLEAGGVRLTRQAVLLE